MVNEREWTGSETAVIGMACRYPKSPNVDAFWENLISGTECISTYTYEELEKAGYYKHFLDDPAFVRSGAPLEEIDLFDAEFFGFTPRDIAILDPQHRLFIEQSWVALEDAAYYPESFEGKIGVFAGCMDSSYYQWNLLRNRELVATMGQELSLFTQKDFLATRTAYKLSLTGPCINVSTACSTSLVAIHLACQSLINGECDLALAGGAAICVPQSKGYSYQEGGIYSPDGHCRPFDKQAAGTLRGAGVGVVALKRLDNAIADGDDIYAVVLSSTVNNDGSDKVGFTAPSVGGQAEAIAEAQSVANISPETIGFIEAHGTATPLGDPIEVRALTQVFRERTDKVGYCALGSVKGNMGHTDAAAGVGGFIKAALALRHRTIPGSLHFSEPNPELDLAKSPFFVNAQTMTWKQGPTPRRAGISSFGIGGTNAHVVVEEAPPLESAAESRDREILCLSAVTEPALEEARGRLADFLESHPDTSLSDLAFTLNQGRKPFKYRGVLVADSIGQVVSGLRGHQAVPFVKGAARREPLSVCMMFSGQGTQYPGMARDLYEQDPIFREHLSECIDILEPLVAGDLRQLLLQQGDDDSGLALQATALAQPALFAVEYALAQWWIHHGIKPDAMVGHSLGEYVAATLAGVFELDKALALVAARGRLMASCQPGVMLSVSADEVTLMSLLPERLGISAVNSSDRCVASGPLDAIELLEEKLKALAIPCRRLRTSHAYHSPMMDPILDKFVAEVYKAKPSTPKIPFISNTSGTWIQPEEAASPTYWARHLRGCVRFYDGLGPLLEKPGMVLLEVGPGATLAQLARRHPQWSAGHAVITSLAQANKADNNQSYLYENLGRMWCTGKQLDWGMWFGEERRRLHLPTYPFQRSSHWISPDRSEPTVQAPLAASQRVEEAKPARTEAQPVASQSRLERVTQQLTLLLADLVGSAPEKISHEENFLEMGIDSLAMMQLSRRIQDKLGVEIPFRALMEEYSDIAQLARHLEPLVVLEEQPAVVSAHLPSSSSLFPPASGDGLAAQIQSHLHALSGLVQQLAKDGSSAPPPQGISLRPFKDGDFMNDGVQSKIVPNAFVAFKPADTQSTGRMTERQQLAFDALVAEYTQFTAKSKAFIAENRVPFADNRNSVGFSKVMKELTYQIVADRSHGAHFTDIDGNDLIDLGMGFGVHLFGNNPAIVQEAICTQLSRGLHLGPQVELAGDLAKLICKLTDVERVAFSNTGTEAVMAALRVARTITGRKKIVIFEGAYHGTFDGVLVRTGKFSNQPRPLSPGVMEGFIEDVYYLPYADRRSLEIIETMGKELAAVIVEPVQSRRPDMRPLTFLRELRRMTLAHGSALIFDEVISGFRVHPGGAQKLFGIQADMVTYGKVVGGGMPIGILAGTAKYLDAIDGGAWQYGDDSYPLGMQTLFAGTFCKHPVSLAAGYAVLKEIERQGPELQERLNQTTSQMVEELNRFFNEEDYPILMTNFGSLFRFFFPPNLAYADLFFFYLTLAGIYTWEGRNCFLSTEHSEADVAAIAAGVKHAAARMRRAGFFFEKGSSLQVLTEATEKIELELTPAQQEIWVMTQMGGSSSLAYNLSMTVDIVGKLQPEKLAAVLQELVNRHNALRLIVDEKGRKQTFKAAFSVAMERVDQRHQDHATRNAERRAFTERAFDLVNGPLVRFCLYQEADECHHLAITFHHLAVDGWSVGILGQDLGALLTAQQSGLILQLPQVMQFSTYVAKTLEAMATTGQDARAFWMQLLSGELPRLKLPTVRPVSFDASNAAARTQIQLNPELTPGLRRYARQNGCTVFILMMAAFQALVHKLSGQDDVIIGIPSAGRNFDGDEQMVGHCVNMLAQRSRLTDDPGLLDFLAAVREQWLSTSKYAFFPLSRIQSKLALAHGQPLFDVTFNMERTAPVPPASETAASTGADEGLGLRVQTPVPPSIQYGLAVDVVDDGQQLSVSCTFRSAFQEVETIQRWLGYYQTLLHHMLEHGNGRLSRLMMMTDHQKQQLLTEFSTAQQEAYDVGPCLHHLFERAAARYPDKVYLDYAGQPSSRHSYDEINSKANRLARLLRQRGVGTESRVGLHSARVPGLIVGLLGILKAGGTYVPLDPGHPDSRLQAIESQAALALTVTTLPEAARGFSAETLELQHDGTSAGAGIGDDRNLDLWSDPDQALYVMFTSGSTGTPKGICATHRGLVNRLASAQAAYPFEQCDAIVQVAGFGFDISIWEFMAPCFAGARLVLIPDQAVGDPEAILNIIRDCEVTVLHSVPSLLRALLGQGMSSESVPKLKTVYTGGDRVPLDLQADCLKALGGHLLQLFGPTEASISNTMVDCRNNLVSPFPNLGRAIPNTKVIILDAYGYLAAPGVTGEICLGGICLTRGYLGRPDLTAERFVPDPHGRGERIYRTGDLGFLMPNGHLVYVGRKDNQIKLRGQRIEPSEIEHVLDNFAEVAQSVVIVVGEPEKQRLAAYVVARPGQDNQQLGLTLKERLGDLLPGYLVPTYLVVMDTFPLTPTGKLDRKALPEPESANVAMAELVHPRDPLEEVLAGIWADHLERETLGVFDNFFDLGGDSLLAAQVKIDINEYLRVDLQLPQFFANATVAGLAAFLRLDPEQARRTDQLAASLVEIADSEGA